MREIWYRNERNSRQDEKYIINVSFSNDTRGYNGKKRNDFRC